VIFFDKRGIPVLPGDTVKVFHYVAARRREKRFMYKFAHSVEQRSDGVKILKLLHLDETLTGYYWQIMDGKRHLDYEIVQGSGGVKSGQDFRDRELLKDGK